MNKISSKDKVTLGFLLFILITIIAGVITSKLPKTLFNQAAGNFPNPTRKPPTKRPTNPPKPTNSPQTYPTHKPI